MANATKAVKTLTGGDKGMFILEPGVLFQRKTNMPDNWKKLRIGMIGSFTNTAAVNATPNAEQIPNPLTLKTVPIIGMSNGVAFPGEAGNRSIGMRGGWGNEYGASIRTAMSFSSPNWTVDTQTMNTLCSDGTTVYGAYPHAGSFLNWRIGDPTADSACMFWFVIELNTATSGQFSCNWWHSYNTPITDASDSALANIISNPSAISGNQNSGFTFTNAMCWWTAQPIGCQYFMIRFPFLQNRIRIMNLMLIDTSNY